MSSTETYDEVDNIVDKVSDQIKSRVKKLIHKHEKALLRQYIAAQKALKKEEAARRKTAK